MCSKYNRCSKISNTSYQPKELDKQYRPRSENVRSESYLFAILTSFLWIPAMITNILFEKEVFKTLEHLPYT